MNSADSPHLSHLDEAGQVRMVDVGHKPSSARVATCRSRVRMSAHAFALLHGHARGKGEVLNTARVAGVLAAKRCAELIPLCHSLPLSFVGIDFALNATDHTVEITATCRSDYKTGVEMEAMTACSVAALTIYDMCKAADKAIVIEDTRLLYKAGGKSGVWRAPADVCDTPAGPDIAQTPPTSATEGEQERATHGGALDLVYFARVAELVGRRHESWPVDGPCTGAVLLSRLEACYPDLAPVARLKLAVNQRHVQHETDIQPGDEVAVFEPVTGG